MAEQIFIFTAGNADAQTHLESTIKQPLPLERVLGLFDESAHETIKEFHNSDGLYAWGAVPGQQNTPRWNAMEPGAWMLCVYENRYRYVSRLLGKFQNSRFAKEIWGTNDKGATWELMYFLSKPIAVDIRVDALEQLNTSYMGFTRIGEEKLAKIRRQFGSLDAFINQVVIGGQSISPAGKETPKTMERTSAPRGALNRLVSHCIDVLSFRGFSFSRNDIANLFLAVKTKPFVILAGISGTGKSKLVQLIGAALGIEVVLIPVKPDWSDNTDLIGYEDFQQQFRPAKLTHTLIKAHENPEQPFFILLDEMNLARVEHYFSDFLSIIETRDRDSNGAIRTKSIFEDGAVKLAQGRETDRGYLRNGLTIPPNLYVFGTVNMDETTHPFSRKVLDRANTIELNEIDLSYNFPSHSYEGPKPLKILNSDLVAPYLTLREVYHENPEFFDNLIAELKEFNDILEQRGLHVGYRVRDELCFYCYLNHKEQLFAPEVAMDFQIHQKLLPRIYGGEELRPVLEAFAGHCERKYPMSYKKIVFMLQRLEHGFTSFWV